MPLSISNGPGEPIPIPSRLSSEHPAVFRVFSIAKHILLTIPSAGFSGSVGIFVISPVISPDLDTMPALILVPPKSTPSAYEGFIINARQQLLMPLKIQRTRSSPHKARRLFA